MIDADSFKLFLPLLTAVVAFFSTLYSQKSAIHKTWFYPIVDLITISLLYAFFTIVYGLVNGMILIDDFYLMIGLIGLFYSLCPIIDLMSVRLQRADYLSLIKFLLLMFFLIVIISYWEIVGLTP